MKSTIPLVIEFAAGSRIVPTAADASEATPPPAETFIVMKNGHQIPIPADQIVDSAVQGGCASVSLGGMSFEGMEDGKFVFWRVRDLLPEDRLSPERGDKMTLDPDLIAKIRVQGTQVYPRTT